MCAVPADLGTDVLTYSTYGGVCVEANAVPVLAERIADIRQERGFAAEDRLRFSPASKPQSMEADAWTGAKADVIAACREHGVLLIAALMAKDLDAELVKAVALRSAVIDAFNDDFLPSVDETGRVLGDTEDAVHDLRTAADLVVGSFAYCLNATDRLDAARKIFPTLAPIVWHKQEGDQRPAMGHGILVVRPSGPAPLDAGEYDAIRRHLVALVTG